MGTACGPLFLRFDAAPRRIPGFSFSWSAFHGHLFEWQLSPVLFRLRLGKITQVSILPSSASADDGVPGSGFRSESVDPSDIPHNIAHASLRSLGPRSHGLFHPV
jgi:hypothetical protein